MRIKHVSSWLRAVVLACLLILGLACLPQTVQAAGENDNTLTLTYAPDEVPMAGVTFRLYRVADVSKERMTVTPVEPYTGYHVLDGANDWLSKAATLAGYVNRDDLEATAQATTNEAGKITVSGLEDGMYLILGEGRDRNNYHYTPVPFLLFLPNTADGYSWEDTVSTHVKFTRSYHVPGDTTVQRRVLKVWEDDGNESERPESITVDLLADGTVYDTVTLDAANHWRYHWTGLDAGVQWQLVERETGGAYTVSVSENGITFVITNTWQDGTDIDDPEVPLEEAPPDEGTDILDEDVPLANLPQTGQLWWPVPLLAMAGVILLALGFARRRRSAWDEE